MNRDIIIHYDETAEKIVVSTVEHAMTKSLLAEALPLETPVSAFRSQDPNEAERMLGAGIFALIDLSSSVKIAIRDYSAVDLEWDMEHTESLESKATVGDPSAQFELAMEKITQGLRTKSKVKMEEADALLQLAVAGGNDEAAAYVTDLWPSLKARSEHW
jgi:hypothetical protein